MRTLGRLTRRRFFKITGMLAALMASLVRPLRAAATEPDYFSGTDFVGKTRAGRYRDFYINYWQPMRRIDPATWTLTLDGLAEGSASLTFDNLKDFPMQSMNSRLKCVECWSARATWTGFPFSELEKLAPPKPEAVGVLFHCADDYKEYLPLDALRHARTLLVTHMNGQPLTDEHGFPLRVICPFKYGYKNPKAILRMEYVDRVTYGTWSKIGPYSPDGTILPGTDHPLEFGKRPRRIPGGEIFDY
ncbi:molybdopterin-dependent oxidoreductase [Nitrospina gracilis]|uniref:molybdopterin-dependent oxidoreductase n=1 Tax=Nitrospina gracilis TaxID=35801 RepID=UPI001F2BDFCE|nr:molybdopterin-dependent oxidoreductase [Nitrospina gracilis]MCF8719805.1 DMSO/TMAO reductase YedYZ molybdopterin-dependent catalytic subunit [Nitrospina gracilis Nb-211]